MYNYFMLMGKIVKEATPKENVDAHEIKLEVTRGFQNSKGEYDVDCFTIVIPNILANLVKDELTKGSRAVIKGRIQSVDSKPMLIAERIINM